MIAKEAYPRFFPATAENRHPCPKLPTKTKEIVETDETVVRKEETIYEQRLVEVEEIVKTGSLFWSVALGVLAGVLIVLSLALRSSSPVLCLLLAVGACLTWFVRWRYAKPRSRRTIRQTVENVPTKIKVAQLVRRPVSKHIAIEPSGAEIIARICSAKGWRVLPESEVNPNYVGLGEKALVSAIQKLACVVWAR